MTIQKTSLENQVALVTGATSGIGRAVAVMLAAAGCKVVATGRNADRLRELGTECGPAVLPLHLDMTDAKGIETLPERLPEGFRSPHILVNNAGEDIGGRARFDTATADELACVIETNLIGAIRMVRAFVPAMLERGSGDIVNLGSIQASRIVAGVAAYTSSKTGLRGLTDVLRADYAKSGIRVLEVSPGTTRTNFAKTRFRGDAERADAFFAERPYTLNPEDVADAIRYALERPRHVSLHHILITPSWQW